MTQDPEIIELIGRLSSMFGPEVVQHHDFGVLVRAGARRESPDGGTTWYPVWAHVTTRKHGRCIIRHRREGMIGEPEVMMFSYVTQSELNLGVDRVLRGIPEMLEGLRDRKVRKMLSLNKKK